MKAQHRAVLFAGSVVILSLTSAISQELPQYLLDTATLSEVDQVPVRLECPRGNHGVLYLVAMERTGKNEFSIFQFKYEDDVVRYVRVFISVDGKAFSELFTTDLSRPQSDGHKKTAEKIAKLAHAARQNICNADVETKGRARDVIRLNAEKLKASAKLTFDESLYR